MFYKVLNKLLKLLKHWSCYAYTFLYTNSLHISHKQPLILTGILAGKFSFVHFDKVISCFHIALFVLSWKSIIFETTSLLFQTIDEFIGNVLERNPGHDYFHDAHLTNFSSHYITVTILSNSKPIINSYQNSEESSKSAFQQSQ